MSYQEQEENSKRRPAGEKTRSATSASQRTESSKAFLKRPPFLFENLTCLLVLSSILANLTFPLFFFVFASPPMDDGSINLPLYTFLFESRRDRLREVSLQRFGLWGVAEVHDREECQVKEPLLICKKRRDPVLALIPNCL